MNRLNLIFRIAFSIIIFHSVFFVGCTSSTKPKTGSLSGIVTLVNDTGDPSLDPHDFSGVTVALYSLATLDTTILRINQEFPSVGLQISQETSFDHRKQQPLFNTETDVAGNFVINDIPYGEYNLTFQKDGWGIRFLYGIEIVSAENSTADRRDSGHRNYSDSIYQADNQESLVLYPITVLTNSITSDFTFKSGHTYIAEDDVVAVSDVSIEQSSLILVGSGVRLDFYGSLETPSTGSLWRIDALHGFLDQEPSLPLPEDRYERLGIFSTTNTMIANGVVANIQDGLTVSSPSSTVIDLILDSGNTAIVFNGSSLLLSRCIVSGFEGRTIMLNGNSIVSKCIVIGNHDSLIMNDHEFDVNNNYFGYNWVGIRPIHGNTVIYNNDFWGNVYGISPIASSPMVEYNNFYGSSRYCFQSQPNYVQDSYEYGNPTLRRNNFYTRDRVVISLRPDDHPGYFGSGNVGVSMDVDARNNYWYADNTADVITDVNDDASINFAVNYMPKLGSPVNSAGISPTD